MSFNKNKLPTIATLALLLLLTPAFAQAANFVEETIYLIINGFLGLFVGLAGFLLNNSIQYSIIDFGHNYLTSGIGAAVESTWVIIRDLFNLTFIFGLIYIGFKMILNSDDSNSRRWLASLIMAALLVNFSLFITKTIVDFTNILATQIVVNGFSTATITGTGDVDISGTFMNNFGLTSLFDAKIPTTASPWGFIFGTAIVFIVCMFVFAAGAILLFIRFAALLMYMIFSPLMFIGWVFPQLQGTTSKYWQGFLGRAFFAPIYVLLLYVSAKVIFGVYGGKTPNYGDATSGVAGDVNASFVNTFPPFIIGCIFLIASIVVASKLGVDGAGAAMKAGQRFRGAVQRRTTQMATAVPRRAGRMATNAAGDATRRGLNRLQTYSGDNRFVKAASKASQYHGVDSVVRGAATKATNAEFGTGTTTDKNKKAQAVVNARVSAAQNISTGATAQTHLNSYDETKEIIDPATGNKVLRSSLSPAALAAAEKYEQDRKDEVNKMQQTLSQKSTKELEELFETDAASFADIVGNLTSKQYDNLMSSDKLSSAEKTNIEKSREISLFDSINKLGADRTKQISKLSTHDLEILGADFINQNAELFTKKQMDDLSKSTKFTNSQITDFNKSKGVNQAKTTQNAVMTTNMLSGKKPADIAAVGSNLLDANGKANAALPFITSDVMKEIIKQGSLTVQERVNLANEINSDPSSHQSAKDFLMTPKGQADWY